MKKKIYRIQKECESCGKIENYYYKTVAKNSKKKSYKCLGCYENMVKTGNERVVIKKEPLDYINLFGY